MNAIHWLFLANAVVWAGLGAYLAFLSGRQKDLERRMDALEENDG